MKTLDRTLLDDAETFNAQAKAAVLAAITQAYGEAWILVETSAPGVDLPGAARVKHQPLIQLQLSDRLARPTRAFSDETGIRFDGSFDRVTYPCFVPWSAVRVIRSPVNDGGEVEHSFGWSPVPVAAEAAPAVKRVAAQAKLRVIKGGCA